MKKSVPPKMFSQNKGHAKESHRCNTTSPKESFNQKNWPQARTRVQLPTCLSACHFLKVRRQEVHSWSDEKAIHTLNGSLIEFMFLQLLPLPFINLLLYILSGPSHLIFWFQLLSLSWPLLNQNLQMGSVKGTKDPSILLLVRYLPPWIYILTLQF